MDTQEKQQNEIMAEKFFSDLAEIRTIKKFDELNPILNEKSELFIRFRWSFSHVLFKQSLFLFFSYQYFHKI
jgi:hypothetical protein